MLYENVLELFFFQKNNYAFILLEIYYQPGYWQHIFIF